MRTDRVYISAEGRLGTDVRGATLERGERRGERMASARVASHLPTSGTASGAKDSETLWLRLVAFGAAAEALESIGKGDRVGFEGTVRKNFYKRRDGTELRTLECVVEKISVDADAVRADGDPRSRLPRPAPPVPPPAAVDGPAPAPARPAPHPAGDERNPSAGGA